MKLGAYVLAADPTWVTHSVAAYYPALDRLVISYDAEAKGWTGHPIQEGRCRALIRTVDLDGRGIEVAGAYSHHADPLEADTNQRQAALDAVGTDLDWVLQLDTDEVLCRPGDLQEALVEAERLNCHAVEWPMRVLYRRLPTGDFVAVRNHDGTPHFEYPGPIAVRPGTTLAVARRTEAPTLRVVIRGDRRGTADADGPVYEIEPGGEIWHNSWARSPRVVWRKIRAWGHNDGGAIYRYYFGSWLPAPVRWQSMQDFHPFSWGRWERLERVGTPPFLAAPSRQSPPGGQGCE